MQARLDELVRDLLGPVTWQPGNAGYDPQLCGLDKRELLEKVVLQQMVAGPFYRYMKEVSLGRGDLWIRGRKLGRSGGLGLRIRWGQGD